MSVEAAPPSGTPTEPNKFAALFNRGGADRGGAIEQARDFGVVAIVVALFIILSVTSDAFFDKTNLLNILDQWAAIGIVAVAVTLVLITGGFDLSVGAVFSLAGVVAAKVANSSGPELGLLLGVLTGLGAGIINGLIVVYWRVNSIIATLATGIIIGGIALQMSSGSLISVEDPAFANLGSEEWLGVTSHTWFWIIIALLFAFLLHKTVFGRRIFAVGGNAEAARLSGVRNGLVLTITYALSGLAAGFAGVMVASRQATGQADAAPGIEFDVIAAVIVGGTSILGGAGAVWRTIVGILLLALIQNGSNLLGIEQTYQTMIYGGIILGAAAIDVWVRRGRTR